MGILFESLVFGAYVGAIAGLAVGVPVAPYAFAVVAKGLLPRLGPGRALALRLKTWPAKGGAGAPEVPHGQVEDLRRRCAARSFTVVSGPRGVGHAGKSHSLGVALRGAGSVLCVPVPAGASHDHVVAAVRNAVVRSTAARADCMERVLRAHRHLFGSPVTVVLQPAAWADGLAPAAVVPGGLDVARLGTLYVVIDADPDALDARMVPVLGRRLVVLQPMRRWQIEALPGLRGLHVSLALAGLDHAVWAVLSGNPGLYRQLDEQVRGRLGSDGDVAPAVESFLRSELAKAVSLRSHALAAEPRLRGLLHSTVADKGVAASALEALSLPRHGAAEQYASQLFQVVEPLKDAHVPFGTCWLVPASPAVAAVLRHGPAVVQLPWAELKASLGADAIAGRAGSCRLGNDDWGARANLPPVCDQMDYLVDYR